MIYFIFAFRFPINIPGSLGASACVLWQHIVSKNKSYIYSYL